jgi:hypothetical protein
VKRAGLAVNVSVVAIVALVLSGCSGSQTTELRATVSKQQRQIESMSASLQSKDAELAKLRAAAAEASSSAAAASSANEQAAQGIITVEGNGPQVFGPFTFKPGGYSVSWEQGEDPALGFNETSFVVSVESKPGDYAQPYQLLSNTSTRTGNNQVTVSGSLYVDVSSSANPFRIVFTPKK